MRYAVQGRTELVIPLFRSRHAEDGLRTPPRSTVGCLLLLLGCLGAFAADARAQACLQWTDRTSAGPSARWGHAMAYDSARGVMVVFGGTDATGRLTDTWEWDGSSWTLRSATGPGTLIYHAMAYDSARGVTVLFGGYNTVGRNGETWEWDGATWTLASTTGPSPRSSPEMAYDSARGVTVLFGGYEDLGRNGETWEWDGATWSLRSSSGPSPRFSHAMVYDSDRGVTVLFGGDGPGIPYELGDTWEWDGTSWTLRSTTGPSPRTRHGMAYDHAQGLVILFGGLDSHGLSDGAWSWDGTRWTQACGVLPPLHHGHAMSFDAGRNVIVMFGGSDGTYSDDTWECEPCPTLTLTTNGEGLGTVAVEPNDPNCAPFAYPFGTAVTLTAEPNDGRTFQQWQIFDPNHPGDANFATVETNNPLTLIMDADKEVTAFFGCGTGVGPVLPFVLGLMGLAVWSSRRR